MQAYCIVADQVDGEEIEYFFALSETSLRFALQMIEQRAMESGLNVSCHYFPLAFSDAADVNAFIGRCCRSESASRGMVDLSGPLVIHPPDPPTIQRGDPLYPFLAINSEEP